MARGKANEEELKNCPACKKHLSRAKRYYRNEKYFCNKNCWLTTKKKADEAVAQAAAEAAEAAKTSEEAKA
ncbi:MAG: hypothetical protein P9M07_01345 [Candidatus Aceula meridiana]|nr:hypothetical protein [Candidatus Aceula meridiana]